MVPRGFRLWVRLLHGLCLEVVWWGGLAAGRLWGEGVAAMADPPSPALQCDGGLQYSACGPPCPPTCRGLDQDLPELCRGLPCLEGCFCPPGTLLHGAVWGGCGASGGQHGFGMGLVWELCGTDVGLMWGRWGAGMGLVR